jgi:hypothetical protein
VVGDIMKEKMKVFISGVIASILIFSIPIFASTNDIKTSTNTKNNNPKISSIYLNNEEVKSLSIIQNEEIYLPLLDIFKKYNIFVKWCSEYGGFIINDETSQKVICIKSNINYIYYEKFHQFKFDANGYLEVVIDEENGIKINKPLIFNNSIPYVSVTFLNKILDFEIENKDNNLYVSRQVNKETYIDYIKNLCLDTYIYYKYPQSTLETTFTYILDELTDISQYGFSSNTIKNMFDMLAYYGKIDKIIGKTYWVKKFNFFELIGDKYDYVFNVKDIKTNKLVSDKNLGFFIKVKIEDITKDSQFITEIAGIKCYFNSNVIFEASADDYEIFEKDPITIFKWSKSIWNKIASDYNFYWIGMTCDMAIMTMGRPNDINRTVTSQTVYEQWVYNDITNNIPQTFLYFKNGKLTSWQD